MEVDSRKLSNIRSIQGLFNKQNEFISHTLFFIYYKLQSRKIFSIFNEDFLVSGGGRR